MRSVITHWGKILNVSLTWRQVVSAMFTWLFSDDNSQNPGFFSLFGLEACVYLRLSACQYAKHLKMSALKTHSMLAQRFF